jgi:hypothetical protein
MTATTSHGTWANHGGGEIDIRTNVLVALGDFVADFDVDALVLAYRNAINKQLPGGITLTGDEFYGPVADEAGDAIKAAVRAVDFWALTEQFDRTTGR